MTTTSDEAFLEELGYKQELKRELTSFSNFAVSFTIISILTGINSLFVNGLVNGGPVVLVYGWVLVFSFALCVALSMAEICSAYPTSGGLYFWAAQLAGTPEQAAFWSWVTGWFNLVGQVATTAGIDFGLATFILEFYAALYPSFEPLAWHNELLFLVILGAHGLLNTFATKILRLFNDLSVWWHIVGTLTIVIAVLAGAPELQDPAFVFTTFSKDDSLGLPNNFYVFLMGLLTAQFT